MDEQLLLRGGQLVREEAWSNPAFKTAYKAHRGIQKCSDSFKIGGTERTFAELQAAVLEAGGLAKARCCAGLVYGAAAAAAADVCMCVSMCKHVCLRQLADPVLIAAPCPAACCRLTPPPQLPPPAQCGAWWRRTWACRRM